MRAALPAILALAGAVAGVAAALYEFGAGVVAAALSVAWLVAFAGGVLALARPHMATLWVTLCGFPAAIQSALLLFAMYPLPAAPVALSAAAMLLLRRSRGAPPDALP